MYYWSWAGGQVIIVRTESEVLGRRTGDHREDWIRGLGPEDRWSSWGLNQRSWAGGQVIIVRTESEVLGRRSGDHHEDLIRGLGPEDRWSSCGLNQIVILLVLTIIPATLWSMIHIAWMYFLYFLILALHLSLHRFILNCKDLRG
jgi:hypothetical protein